MIILSIWGIGFFKGFLKKFGSNRKVDESKVVSFSLFLKYILENGISFLKMSNILFNILYSNYCQEINTSC